MSDSLGTFFCKNCQQDTTINDDYSEGLLRYYVCRKWKYQNSKWSFEHKASNKGEWKWEEFKTKEVWNKWPWYCNKCNHRENDFTYFVKDYLNEIRLKSFIIIVNYYYLLIKKFF